MIRGFDMNDNRRDTTRDKKRIKTVFKIVAAAIAVLAAVAFAAEIIAGKLSGDGESSAADPKEYSFFEADYGENILEDEVYLALDRNIAFASHGKEIFLDRETADSLGGAAKMFFEYFQCIINGDYDLYPSFFTEKYLSDKNADIPARFTMQKIYDIGVKLFSVAASEPGGGMTEIYEVRYSIFENNGTFRRDIRSMETRTLVFEIYTDAARVSKINAIAFRGEK